MQTSSPKPHIQPPHQMRPLWHDEMNKQKTCRQSAAFISGAFRGTDAKCSTKRVGHASSKRGNEGPLLSHVNSRPPCRLRANHGHQLQNWEAQSAPVDTAHTTTTQTYLRPAIATQQEAERMAVETPASSDPPPKKLGVGLCLDSTLAEETCHQRPTENAPSDRTYPP